MRTQTVQRSIRLPRDVYEAVTAISLLEDRTLAQVIRRAVLADVEAKQLDTPAKRSAALRMAGKASSEMSS